MKAEEIYKAIDALENPSVEKLVDPELYEWWLRCKTVANFSGLKGE